VFRRPAGTIHDIFPVKALIVDDFDRTALNCLGHAKLGGNTRLFCSRAIEAGAKVLASRCISIVPSIKRHKEVDEFSTYAFKAETVDCVTVIVLDSKCTIENITSDGILQISRSFGWKIEKRLITYIELPDFTEVLVPVPSITRRQKLGLLPPSARVSVNSDSEAILYMPQEEAGPVFSKLLTQFRAIR